MGDCDSSEIASIEF